MGRFTGQTHTLGVIGEDLYADFPILRSEPEKMDTAMLAWASTLQEAWLNQVLAFTSIVDGKTRRGLRWVFVAQLFNHQTRHRGQVTTLMRQLGYEPGITDIPRMLGVIEVA